MPRLVWGAIATGVGVAALALIAAPAHATTDRVDYSDQANPICISANKQTVQVYEPSRRKPSGSRGSIRRTGRRPAGSGSEPNGSMTSCRSSF
jgi:hypothetical protein